MKPRLLATLLALSACAPSADRSAGAASSDSASSAPVATTTASRDSLPPATDRAAWYARARWTEGCEREHREMSRSEASGVRVHPLGGERYLVEAECFLAAYQARYNFVLYDASAAPPRATLLRFPEHDGERWLVEDGIAGEPAVDTARGELSVFSKSRGLGDCGQVVRYAFAGGAPKLVEVRARDCGLPPEEGEEIPPPGAWPLVPLAALPPLETTTDAQAVTIRGLTAGDRGCYVEVEDAGGRTRTEMADFELCERDDLAGRRARLTYGSATVAAAACQGDPACARSDTVRIVARAEPLP
ncbi:MAG TPA: DUF1176 domain-containing protein [Longimicrobium sp.]|nr:DUF1176 domain-containing protein [Longimicrobium sp.]